MIDLHRSRWRLLLPLGMSAGLLILTAPAKARANRPPGERRWGYITESFLSDPGAGRIRSDYDVLTLIGTRLEADGTLTGQPRTVSGIQEKLPLVYPMVSFRDAEAGRRLLQSDSARAKAIGGLRQLARRDPFAGVHLDLEYLSAEEAPLLARFLQELHPLLVTDRRTLSLAIFPANFPARYASFHDLSLIGRLADEFVLMTYDLHRPSTSPGPVTDVRWAEEAIRLARLHVPQTGLWLGVPAYGYEWTLPSGRFRTLTGELFQQIISRKASVIRRDPSGCLFASYSGTEETRTVAYFPDREMRQALERLAKKKGLQGTALWRADFLQDKKRPH